MGTCCTTSYPEVDLDESARKLLFLYNNKSGNFAGVKFAELFEKCGCETFCLQDINDPKHSVEGKDHIRNLINDGFTVAVAGGDGTNPWAISIFDSMELNPLIALFPMGSGNNLARCTGYTNVQIPITENAVRYYIYTINKQIQEGHCIDFDRWQLHINYGSTQDEDFPAFFLNYLTIGLEGSISKQAESFRGYFPMVCGFVLSGIFPMLCGSCCYSGVAAQIEQIPERTKYNHNLIFANIPSYAGKTDLNLWGDGAYFNDGQIEVCSHDMHNIILMNLGCAKTSERILQSNHLKLELSKANGLQIDGEGFDLSPCTLEISKHPHPIRLVLGPTDLKGLQTENDIVGDKEAEIDIHIQSASLI